ncbi:LysR family transcriptional regulator [Asaia bogorensis]|uniref:LysR family transcriptional regulator n=1 Tax=Asaia bogorensis TaxID=91915 RepID=UPI0013C4AE4F|nr:LysR family transcriptional regulator [Asaia bogorensis]
MDRLGRLDLTQLRALDLLVTTQSVTRTASLMSVTQPAISNMLARLRETFDDPLLVRQGRSLVCTPRALALAKPLRAILTQLDSLAEPVIFDPATASLTLSVAATDYAIHTVLLPFIARLRVVAPGIRIALHDLNGETAQDHLERGVLDWALLSSEACTPALHAQKLFHETWLCATRLGHPALSGGMTLDRFCKADHVVVSPDGGGFEAMTDAALRRLNLKRHVAVSASGFLMVPDLLTRTDLVAVLPSRLLATRHDLTVFAPPAPLVLPGFDKYLVWGERTHVDPAHRALRKLLSDTCHDLALPSSNQHGHSLTTEVMPTRAG